MVCQLYWGWNDHFPVLNQDASLDSCQTSHANAGESGQVSCFSSGILNWFREDPQLYKYDVSEEEERKET